MQLKLDDEQIFNAASESIDMHLKVMDGRISDGAQQSQIKSSSLTIRAAVLNVMPLV